MFSDTTAFGPRLARHEWQMLLDRWQRLQPYADRFATAFFDTLFGCEPDFAHRFGGATLEAQFLVADGHVNDEIEQVVERRRGFLLVEKVKPLVAQTVRRLNPRTV